ncbi:hypothetical protein ABZY45_13905 [Streptomyces sp. NPDC006516]|uniref:hypothetical protein n=1 Tax=Streptomyces sp. NPDC006516 TaxID=3154309 RepID=UPI0033B1B4CB
MSDTEDVGVRKIDERHRGTPPALVWDERHRWHAATARRHPLTKGATPPPPGDGIRYLADGTPTEALITALTA